MIEQMAKAMRPLRDRVMLMVARGVVQSVADGAGTQQTGVGLLAGETRGNVDRLQQFGMSSNPPPGSAAVVLSIGGNRDHPIMIAAEHPDYRPTGQPAGGTTLYDTAGSQVVLKADGSLIATAAAGGQVTLATDGTASLVARGGATLTLHPDGTITCSGAGGSGWTVNGDGSITFTAPVLRCTGDILDNSGGTGRTMAAMRQIYDAHIHGGVAAGSASTATPTGTM